MTKLYILYGSATGNAEGIAKDLAEKEPPSHFSSVVCKPLETFKKLIPDWSKPPSDGAKHGIIVICSTTGNGDPPENASRFVRYIKRSQTVAAQPFQHCAFSVLGLGDTNYDQFCATGKIIDKKMAELGGTRASELACADEATGLEDVVEPFIESVHSKILNACITQGADSASMTSDGNDGTLLHKHTENNFQSSPEDHASEASPILKKKPTKSEYPLFILYGSETGNSEQIAKDLAQTYEMLLRNPDARTFFPSVVCCELNKFKKHLPTWEQKPVDGTKHGLIIISSTTGNGDAPENCGRFTRFIKRKQTIEMQPFRYVGYAVLGLGDTNYDQFCATGKVIDKKLTELGGVQAKQLVCADEATGLEDVVDPWTTSIISEITESCLHAVLESSRPALESVPVPLESKIKRSRETEEEKKSETISEQNISPMVSDGVNYVKSRLDLKKASRLPDVDKASLPSLGASRATCTFLVSDDKRELLATGIDDDESVASANSDEPIYTQKEPYVAKIVASRYLTKTPLDAAAAIVEAARSTVGNAIDMKKARQVIDSHFPLVGTEVHENSRNGKRVIEISVDLPDDNSFEYQPGDSIGLMVPNDPSSVSTILDNLRDGHGVDPSQLVVVNDEKPATVEDIIRHRVDLRGTLKNKKILLGLSQFATNEEEANALRILASKDDCSEQLFQEFIVSQRRSFLDILNEFPSCRKITFEGILSLLPAVAPRYYSVASSPLTSGKQSRLSIALSVVDYLTPSLIVGNEEKGRRRIRGFATGYLENLCSPLLVCPPMDVFDTPTIRIYPKPSENFRLPADSSTPLVLIGPGTGVAPFMGFLAHRKAERHKRGPLATASSESVGDIQLYFGCRHASHDWLYENEMKSFVEEKILSGLHTAFSRDSENHEYVQDLMMRESVHSCRLVEMILEEGAWIYICGDGNKMARDVQTKLVELLSKKLNEKEGLQAGKDYIEKMKREGKFLLDIWS